MTRTQHDTNAPSSTLSTWTDKMIRILTTWLMLVCLPTISYAGGKPPTTPRQSTQTTSKTMMFQEGAWIPLTTYKHLLQRQTSKQDSLLRLGEGHYKAHYRKKGFHVEATMYVEKQSKGWQSIDVLWQKYPLRKATLNGRPALLFTKGANSSYVKLALKEAGRHTLKMTFFIPQKSGPDPQTKLHFAPGSTAHFVVVFPSNHFRPTLKGGYATKITRSKGKTSLKTILHPQKTSLTLRWWKAEQTQTSQKKTSKRSRLYARTYSLLSVGRGGQDLFFTVRYTIVHAPKQRFQFVIPKGLRIRQVHGLGLRDYQLLKQKNKTVLDVLLVEPVTERYEISVLAELQQRKHKSTILLPEPLGVQRESGYLGIEVIGNDEINVIPHHAATIDVRELPSQISQGTTRPILRAYRFGKRPVSWSLLINRYTNINTPASTIDKAQYTTVSNKTGKLWVQASYLVRNTFKQFIAIKLPTNAKLKSAFVAKKPVKPAKDGDKVLIPLKRSGKQAGNTFQVELVYSVQSKGFGGVTQHTFALPSIDIWISELQWALYLPEGKVTWKTDILGNERVRGYSNWKITSPLSLSSRLSNRRSFTQRTQRTHNPSQQIFRNYANQTQTVGTLPVKIQLPRWGRRYSFKRYYLAPHTTTTLDLQHRSPWLRTLGIGLLLFSGLFLGFAFSMSALHRRHHSLVLLGSIVLSIGTLVLATQLTLFHYQTFVLGGFLGMCVSVVVGIMLRLNQRQEDLSTEVTP
ncbi:MAG: hypothetical protein CL920_25065 [Deltaproteobacteria bacterium]|nr:hypothetical protein [Deltaproteobacteria bacterium]MBU51976.1 hypothetical protein [Deltaproteobacteria bacterium]